MLAIRLQRVGRKNDPSFRLVVVDSHRSSKTGNFLEVLGSYDSRQKDKTIIKEERVKHWLSVGAKPSDTAHNLLVKKQIIKGDKIDVAPKKPAPQAAPAPAQATEAKEETPVAEAEVSQEEAAKEEASTPAEGPVATEDAAAPDSTPEETA